ncbi:MAG: DUF1573 domain-containing protein [Bacteroidales bacterium]|jgi:hypothetical protein|nr:DUF1573 domain-containing protein [Bacteroidales bacterium]
MKISSILQSLVLASIIAVLLVVASCGGNSGRDNLPVDIIQNPNTAEGINKNVEMPAFEFVKDFHDFGRVIQGEQVSFGFKFKNSGNALLLISSVSSSCGCTVASFPDKPMKPGEEGVITVSFDSRGRMGMQMKTVTILANTQPGTKQLMVQANIVVPETMNF